MKRFAYGALAGCLPVQAQLALSLIAIGAQAAPDAGRDPGAAVADDVAPDAFPELPEELSAESVAASEGDAPDADLTLGLQTQLWAQTLVNRVGAPSSDVIAQTTVGRLVLDLRRELPLGGAWRGAVSNRFEAAAHLLRDDDGTAYDGAWNSLRELWLGYQWSTPTGVWGASAGRINVRSGVGSGYNPSDFFKENAVRTSVSLDPQALRMNRLGAVMLEAHYSGSIGTVTGVIAPQLAARRESSDGLVMDDDAWYSLGLSRTNARSAALLKWELQLSEAFSADVLAFMRTPLDTRAAVNLSGVLHDSIVANAEWAVGQCRPLPLPSEPANEWTVCAWGATNVTWTTPLGFDLTLEHQYAGDALSGEAWRAWREANASANLAGLALQRALQREPLVRHGWFVRVGWREPFDVRGLSLSAMAQVNGYDGSSLGQAGVDWQNSSDWLAGANVVGFLGAPDTEFGMTPSRASFGAYVGHAW